MPDRFESLSGAIDLPLMLAGFGGMISLCTRGIANGWSKDGMFSSDEEREKSDLSLLIPTHTNPF
jgi:hypothetical protein